MSEFEKWFKSLNENGRVTYFLGQESKIAEEAWFASACTSTDHIHRLQHEKANQKAETGVERVPREGEWQTYKYKVGQLDIFEDGGEIDGVIEQLDQEIGR